MTSVLAIQKEFWLRAVRALSQLFSLFFLFTIVSDMSQLNMVGLALSVSLWVLFDLFLAHQEILTQVSLANWFKKALAKTTQRKQSRQPKKEAREEEERQPVY